MESCASDPDSPLPPLHSSSTPSDHDLQRDDQECIHNGLEATDQRGKEELHAPWEGDVFFLAHPSLSPKQTALTRGWQKAGSPTPLLAYDNNALPGALPPKSKGTAPNLHTHTNSGGTSHRIFRRCNKSGSGVHATGTSNIPGLNSLLQPSTDRI
eukprot:gene13389-biopygen14090